MAWYPVYRIPDAPLSARFLTFHNVALRDVPPPLGRVPSARVTGQRPCCLQVTGAAALPGWDDAFRSSSRHHLLLCLALLC